MKDTLIEVEDDRCNSTNWDKRYHIILSSFTSNRASIKPSEYTIYTDGSKTENGVGSGFVIYHKREREAESKLICDEFSIPPSKPNGSTAHLLYVFDLTANSDPD